jgi:uncharacterized OB-fold protein
LRAIGETRTWVKTEGRIMMWAKEAARVAAVLLALAMPAMGAQDAGESEVKETGRVATGAVVAVTPASRTVVVESRLEGKPWILGIEVPDGLAVTAGGKTRKLEDLKAGDRVRLRWIREENRLVAASLAVVEAKAP